MPCIIYPNLYYRKNYNAVKKYLNCLQGETFLSMGDVWNMPWMGANVTCCSGASTFSHPNFKQSCLFVPFSDVNIDCKSCGGSCIGTISFFRSDPSCLRNKNAKHTLPSHHETNMAENISCTWRVATYGSGIKIQK